MIQTDHGFSRLLEQCASMGKNKKKKEKEENDSNVAR